MAIFQYLQMENFQRLKVKIWLREGENNITEPTKSKAVVKDFIFHYLIVFSDIKHLSHSAVLHHVNDEFVLTYEDYFTEDYYGRYVTHFCQVLSC